jgi:hypothetical protein
MLHLNKIRLERPSIWSRQDIGDGNYGPVLMRSRSHLRAEEAWNSLFENLEQASELRKTVNWTLAAGRAARTE